MIIMLVLCQTLRDCTYDRQNFSGYPLWIPLHTAYMLCYCQQWGGPSGIEAWSLGLLFLQCFDTVGWVFRPIKPVPDMTYNVFGGMLNLAQLNCVMIIKQLYSW